jgi:hypothetical protein
MYIVFKHYSKKDGLEFGGLFTMREKAKEVVERENAKLSDTKESWYDFIKVELDDDFLQYAK